MNMRMDILTPIVKEKINTLAHAGLDDLFRRFQEELVAETIMLRGHDIHWNFPVVIPGEEARRLEDGHDAKAHYHIMKELVGLEKDVETYPCAPLHICEPIWWKEELPEEEMVNRIFHAVTTQNTRYPEAQGLIIHPAEQGDIFTDPKARMRIYCFTMTPDRNRNVLEIKGHKITPGKMFGDTIEGVLDPKYPEDTPVELVGHGFILTYHNTFLNCPVVAIPYGEPKVFGNSWVYPTNDDLVANQVAYYLRTKMFNIVDECGAALNRTVCDAIKAELEPNLTPYVRGELTPTDNFPGALFATLRRLEQIEEVSRYDG